MFLLWKIFYQQRPRVAKGVVFLRGLGYDETTMEDLAPIIGNNLAKLRNARGLTQGQLAEKFNYTDKSISKWECGEGAPDINTLQALADFYGVTIDYLCHPHSDAALQAQGSYDVKKIRSNRIVFSALLITWVWTIVVSFYVATRLLPATQDWHGWTAFLWGAPATFLVMIVMNRKWGFIWLDIPFALLCIWSFLAALYIELGLNLSWQMWPVFIAGIPISVVIVLRDIRKLQTRIRFQTRQ